MERYAYKRLIEELNQVAPSVYPEFLRKFIQAKGNEAERQEAELYLDNTVLSLIRVGRIGSTE